MDEITRRKRLFISIIVLGGIGVAAASIALAASGFPGTSPASMTFFAALGGSGLLAIVSYAARLIVKVPAKWRVTKVVMFRAASRLSFFAAQLMLVALALLALPFGHGVAPLLFHGLIVAMLITALWLLASDAATNFALLSKRFRDSITPAE